MGTHLCLTTMKVPSMSPVCVCCVWAHCIYLIYFPTAITCDLPLPGPRNEVVHTAQTQTPTHMFSYHSELVIPAKSRTLWCMRTHFLAKVYSFSFISSSHVLAHIAGLRSELKLKKGECLQLFKSTHLHHVSTGKSRCLGAMQTQVRMLTPALACYETWGALPSPSEPQFSHL